MKTTGNYFEFGSKVGSLVNIIKEFIPHSANYCVKDLSKAIKQNLESKIKVIEKEIWDRVKLLDADSKEYSDAYPVANIKSQVIYDIIQAIEEM